MARSSRPASTKNGAPNGATASRRTAPPASRPVRMRPRTRSPPARPDNDNSPSIDRNPLQAAVAVANASAAVGSGVGVPAGRGGVRAAQEIRQYEIEIRKEKVPRRPSLLLVIPSFGRNPYSLLRISYFLFLGLRGFDLLLDRGAIDRFAVAGERASARRQSRRPCGRAWRARRRDDPGSPNCR